MSMEQVSELLITILLAVLPIVVTYIARAAVTQINAASRKIEGEIGKANTDTLTSLGKQVVAAAEQIAKNQGIDKKVWASQMIIRLARHLSIPVSYTMADAIIEAAVLALNRELAAPQAAAGVITLEESE